MDEMENVNNHHKKCILNGILSVQTPGTQSIINALFGCFRTFKIESELSQVIQRIIFLFHFRSIYFVGEKLIKKM